VVTLVTLVAALADTAVRNRPVRLARDESVAHYYGHLVLGH
ncbi:MAG: hypothetical protein JWO46_1484, partial [Nocardioidaceae bacterium]|nr:hypothetical protein [Nocardioidaceae bacterium]